jgi:DNA repair protein RadC
MPEAREQASLYRMHEQRVHELPRGQQPRELVESLGVKHVQDEVLLAIILRTGVPSKNVLELSRELLTKYGSLTELSKAPTEELTAIVGLGPVKVQILQCALELATRLQKEGGPDRPIVRTPEEAVGIFRERVRAEDVENFWALHLDTRYRLIGKPRQISRGILDASLVHPREVFREAVRSSAAAMILLHNHPSGDTTPSGEDLRITRQLVEAGKLMGIDVLDHVIIGRLIEDGGTEHASLRESGLVEF